ncbi:MAG: DNA-processing protein DprA, partial [Myxococcales bacterium]|nr:DNA-processing protein DprA [Myxococcales bacterium]
MNDTIDLACLWSIPGIGAVRLRRLLEHFRGARACLEAGPRETAAVLNEPLQKYEPGWPDGAIRDQVIAFTERPGRWICVRGEPEFPSQLEQVSELPIIFGFGEQPALSAEMLAVVGTRRVGRDGLRLTTEVSRWCIERGWGVVSGGAIGVDSEAHRTALSMAAT